MKASELKKGDTIQVQAFYEEDGVVKEKFVPALITRATDHYVWYANSGWQRKKRELWMAA